jgi:hypothetical protein
LVVSKRSLRLSRRCLKVLDRGARRSNNVELHERNKMLLNVAEHELLKRMSVDERKLYEDKKLSALSVLWSKRRKNGESR